MSQDQSRASEELRQLVLELEAPSYAKAVDQGSWLVVAAHPDDETIGASWILARAPRLKVLFVTDGAPRDQSLWPPGAPPFRKAYAEMRIAEARQALSVARGTSQVDCIGLQLVDQEAADDLAWLTERMEAVFAALRPTFVVAHPYEGGHPDHDATAFAVHLSLRRRARHDSSPPLLLEMTSYHAWQDRFQPGKFLPSASPDVERVFSPRDRQLKLQMLNSFVSQAEDLLPFLGPSERFRRAPSYDFRNPPHEGVLNYERAGWFKGAQFCEHANRAIEKLA